MPQYLLVLSSERSTFTMALESADDDGAIAKAIELVRKAKAPVGAKVRIVRPDQIEMDLSEAVAPYLDRPGF